MKAVIFWILSLEIGSILAVFCSFKGCCKGRDDNCFMPRGAGVCYCDQFCVQNLAVAKNVDCCPDYFNYCTPGQGINLTCYSRLTDKYYNTGDTFMADCNECQCAKEDLHMSLKCELDECVNNGEALRALRHQRRGWRAATQPEFDGVKLTNAFLTRLGTKNFRRQVGKMNAKNVRVEHLPEDFDAEEHWPGYIQGPQNQGESNGSWAFSTVSVASDRWAISSKGQMKEGLSVRHIYLCNKRQTGHLSRAWKFLRQFGLVPRSCLEWSEGRLCDIPSQKNASFATCPKTGARVKLYKMTPSYRIRGEREIMQEIKNNGPVQATMTVFRDFFLYTGGIYRCPPKRNQRQGYHSVKIIGWGVENGTKYWKAVNWWGTQWGSSGYFKILKGLDECNIESFIVGAFADYSTFDNYFSYQS